MVIQKYHYEHIPAQTFVILKERYSRYLATIDDINYEPVRVFDPLNTKQVEELELIRNVSRELQKKKHEDVKKAAADREELSAVKNEEKPEVEDAKKEE